MTAFSKPYIERWFRTLQHGLISKLPGFKGHSPEERQALRAKHSMASRRGQDERELFSVSLSSEELQKTIDEWTRNRYCRRSSTAAGMSKMSPFEKAASCRRPLRHPPTPRALDVLLIPGGHERTVTKKGIKTEHGLYIAAELGDCVGRRVHVRPDPTNWGVILVFEEDEETYICDAVDPTRDGVNRAEIAVKARARWRKGNTERRARENNLKRKHQPGQSMSRVLGAASDCASRVVKFPKPRKTQNTPALAEAERAAANREAAEVVELPQAAGDYTRDAWADFLPRGGGRAAQQQSDRDWLGAVRELEKGASPKKETK